MGKKDKDKEVRICMVGGQALMEGIMMRGQHGYSQVVRNPEGELVIETETIPASKRHKFFDLPIVRGSYRLIDSLKIGMKALFSSAEVAMTEEEAEENKSKFDLWVEKKLGDKAMNFFMGFAIVLSLGLSVLLFFLLPNLIANLIISKGSSRILYNLVEGLVRISIFLVYLFAVSIMKDIRRVFMYHGAEHKTIHCYEHDEELTVENVKKYTTLHPRCGTAFLFVVMVISILIYSIVPRYSFFINILIRIVLLPLIAGIAYEFNRFAGNNNNILTKILRAPGLGMQYFTTKEPDDQMIELAIVALNEALRIDDEVNNPKEDDPTES